MTDEGQEKQKVIKVLQDNPQPTKGHIIQETGLSSETVGEILDELFTEEKTIEKHGTNSLTRYKWKGDEPSGESDSGPSKGLEPAALAVKGVGKDSDRYVSFADPDSEIGEIWEDKDRGHDRLFAGRDIEEDLVRSSYRQAVSNLDSTEKQTGAAHLMEVILENLESSLEVEER